MQKRFKTIFILFAGGALIFGVLFLRVNYLRSHRQSQILLAQKPAHSTLYGGTVPIQVTIADTETTREQGLSDTTSLLPDTGLLFMFETPGMYGFWMKDMHYSLDFVWLSADMKIIAVNPNVAPETYPKVFYPPQAVRAVLEINANTATENGLVVGTTLHLGDISQK